MSDHRHVPSRDEAETEVSFDASSLSSWGIASPDDDVFTTSHRYGPHRRLIAALNQQQRGRAELGPSDLVTLVRSVLMAEGSSAAATNTDTLQTDRSSDCTRGFYVPHEIADRDPLLNWKQASMQVVEDGPAGIHLTANPWRPTWASLGAAQALPEASLPERALYEARPRRPEGSVSADPMLSVLGWTSYNADAQREAVRTVLSAPRGSTVIVNLPTGAGKSACALLPALLAENAETTEVRGVTPIVVPTIALQRDLEDRTAQVVAHRTAYRPEDPSADEIRARTRAGSQGPVFLSPESLVGSFADALRTAARRGALRAFVVDEAHMITAWGDDFRPAFQQIAALRRELLSLCPTRPFTTILMSATLTPYSLETLYELFGEPGPVHHVHAVRLRPEPSYWVAEAPSESERRAMVLDAVHHLPRPLILYTTKRADAESWHNRLRQAGFLRCALMHGGSTDEERDDVLRRWAADEIDVMVATSAFGLGVDKRDVRAVVHAALPESIDRFYQDVGRSGRDGWGSISLLAWCAHDVKTARGLALPTFIGAERGFERWKAMFFARDRVMLGNEVYELPLDVPPSHRAGDMDMDSEENALWNLRTLLLLARCRLIELTGAPANAVPLDAQPMGQVRASSSRRIVIRVCNSAVHDEGTWSDVVHPRRNAFLDSSRKAWELMSAAVNAQRCLASIFTEAYRSQQLNVPVIASCGGCPACRRAGIRRYPGRLVARHTPTAPWPPTPVGGRLSGWLQAAPLGIIFYPSDLTAPKRSLELWPAVRWLVDEGVFNLVLSAEVVTLWGDRFRRHPDWRLYLHDTLPTGITSRLPMAVVNVGDTSGIWPLIWERRAELPRPSVLVLPDNLTEPSRPDRLVRDILVGPPRLTLDQWKELYLE